MQAEIDKEKATYIGFVAYVATCMWFTSLTTAFLILPLVLFAWGWIFLHEQPYAVCLISKDKDKCLSVMEDLAESLGVQRVIIYEAKGEDDYEHLGTLELQDEIEIDLDLEDQD